MKLKIIFFVGILFVILSVSAVSAMDLDNASMPDSSSDINDSSLYVNNSLDSENVGVGHNQSSGTFDDLQLEINNAPAGSVLDLNRDYKGHYGSRIDLSKDLTIDGHGHTLDCLGEGGCSAFYSTRGNIVLKNIIISNGHNDYSDRGGAIYITDSAQYTLENCTFEKNWADDYGGAIYNGADKPLTIRNCVFDSNTAKDCDGGAIWSEGVVYVENSVFRSNNAYRDGGAIFGVNNVNVNCCLFDSNRASGASSQCYGGAIRSKAGVNVENSTFTHNYAYDYGGAIYADYININVHQESSQPFSSFFMFNKVEDDNGGAIYADSDLNALNTEFSQNHAKVEGGAVFTCGNAIVSHCLFTSNGVGGAKSQCYGGAIRSKHDARVNNCTFDSNSAEDYGGAIYAADVYINGNQNCSEPFSTFFIKNHADDNNGGAIFIEGKADISNAVFSSNTALVDGGAVFCKNNVNLNHCLFELNKATKASVKCYGGAVRSNDICINNCTFERNFADNYGGAIYANTMRFADSPSYFIENSVKNGHGGAIYVEKFGSSVIRYATFRDNDAPSTSSDGGAVYVKGKCSFTFEQCAFISNHCGDEGGAIYLDSGDSKMALLNNVFIGNVAEDEGQSAFTCGCFGKVHNNFWGGVNPTSSNDQLIEWMVLFIPNFHKVDDNPLKLRLNVSVDYSGSKPVVVADLAFYLNNGDYYDGGIYDMDCLSFVITPNLNVMLQEKTLNRLYAELMPKTGGKVIIMAKFYDFYTVREVEINT